MFPDMNRCALVVIILLFAISSSCMGQYASDAVIASAEEIKPVPVRAGSDTVHIRPDRAEIAWKGTKMWGRGMHTGIVPVKKGFLLYHNNRLAGGTVTADMTSIGITDIPPDQPGPIRILTGHLEDEVFFDTEHWPEAEFTFTGLTHISDRQLEVSGNLTIKDVTRNITVPVSADSSAQAHTYSTRFRINRFDWNIAYRGGFGATRFAARNFVDKYIELNITIAAEQETGPDP